MAAANSTSPLLLVAGMPSVFALVDAAGFRVSPGSGDAETKLLAGLGRAIAQRNDHYAVISALPNRQARMWLSLIASRGVPVVILSDGSKPSSELPESLPVLALPVTLNEVIDALGVAVAPAAIGASVIGRDLKVSMVGAALPAPSIDSRRPVAPQPSQPVTATPVSPVRVVAPVGPQPVRPVSPVTPQPSRPVPAIQVSPARAVPQPVRPVAPIRPADVSEPQPVELVDDDPDDHRDSLRELDLSGATPDDIDDVTDDADGFEDSPVETAPVSSAARVQAVDEDGFELVEDTRPLPSVPVRTPVRAAPAPSTPTPMVAASPTTAAPVPAAITRAAVAVPPVIAAPKRPLNIATPTPAPAPAPAQAVHPAPAPANGDDDIWGDLLDGGPDHQDEDGLYPAAFEDAAFSAPDRSLAAADVASAAPGDPFPRLSPSPVPPRPAAAAATPMTPVGTFTASRVMSRTHRSSGLAPLIVVFASKGGVGKTTTAIALAERAATNGGLNVALIDGNRGQADIGTYLWLTAAALPTVLDAAYQGDPLAAISTPSQVNAARSKDLKPLHFYLVPGAASELADPNVVTVEVLRRLVDLCRSKCDLVVVDSQIVEDYDLSGIFDEILIPALIGEGGWGVGITDTSRPGLKNLYRRLGQFRGFGAPENRLLSFVNRTIPKFEGTGAAEAETNYGQLSQYLGHVRAEDDAITHAMNTGQVPHDVPEIAKILDTILHRVTGMAQFDPTQHATTTAKRGLLARLRGGAR